MEERVAALRALTGTPRTGRDGNSPDTRELILETARDLIVREGVGSVTTRGVARALGISPGNVGYHFANIDELLHALVDWVLQPYLRAFEFLREDTQGNPTASLRAVLNYVLDDLATADTTMFFPELWVMANRNPLAAQRMRELYDIYMDVLRELVAAARPDLKQQHVEELALFICASIEGQTVFIGHERPYAQHREALKAIALNTMADAVENYPGTTPG